VGVPSARIAAGQLCFSSACRLVVARSALCWFAARSTRGLGQIRPRLAHPNSLAGCIGGHAMCTYCRGCCHWSASHTTLNLPTCPVSVYLPSLAALSRNSHTLLCGIGLWWLQPTHVPSKPRERVQGLCQDFRACVSPVFHSDSRNGEPGPAKSVTQTIVV
jgi:hypothetical protein